MNNQSRPQLRAAGWACLASSVIGIVAGLYVLLAEQSALGLIGVGAGLTTLLFLWRSRAALPKSESPE